VHRPARGRMDTGVSLRTALASTATGRRGTKVLVSMVRQRIMAVTPPRINRAVISTPGRAIAVRVAARVFGSRASQVQAIARQQISRVTPTAKVAAVVGGAVGAERAIEAVTGRSPARMIFDLTRAAGQRKSQASLPLPQRRASMANGRQLAVQHVVVNQWQTFPGGPIFTRFADGHIEVPKKDGTIKHYRPYRPVVIPKKWNARSMSRVATALKRQRKTATKILQLTGGVPKRTVRVSAREHRSVDV